MLVLIIIEAILFLLSPESIYPYTSKSFLILSKPKSKSWLAFLVFDAIHHKGLVSNEICENRENRHFCYIIFDIFKNIT